MICIKCSISVSWNEYFGLSLNNIQGIPAGSYCKNCYEVACQKAQEHIKNLPNLLTQMEEWTNKYQALISKWKSTINQEITLLREILSHE